MKNTKFYACETCGNIITAAENAEINCCGKELSPLQAKEADEDHGIGIEHIEEDYFITFSHPMEKEHFISFFAYVRFDRVLLVRLYPEQSGELRFPEMRGGSLYYYCNTHGLFKLKI